MRPGSDGGLSPNIDGNNWGGATSRAFFEKWPAEQTTLFDSAARGRRSDLHLQHFPSFALDQTCLGQEIGAEAALTPEFGSRNRASGIGEDFVSGTRSVKGKTIVRSVRLPPFAKCAKDGPPTALGSRRLSPNKINIPTLHISPREFRAHSIADV